MQVAKYAAYLRRVRPTSAAAIVFVESGHFRALEKMHERGASPWPLVYDRDLAIARRLRVPPATDRSLLVAADGRVLFGPPQGTFTPENLRQLWERVTRGAISWPDLAGVPAPRLGQIFPDVPVEALATGRTMPLYQAAPPGKKAYLVFTASCAACDLDGALASAAGALRDGNAVAVVTSAVPMPVLRRIAGQYAPPLPVLAAKAKLSGFESLYDALGSSVGTVVRVITDARGRITAYGPLGYAGMPRPIPGPAAARGAVVTGLDLLGCEDPLIAARNGRVFALDGNSDRLYIERGGTVVRATGSVGPEPGEFYQPEAIALTSSALVIYDRGNRRVQILSPQGQFLEQFPVPTGDYGMAASDSGVVYINDPRSGHLITKYSFAGRVLGHVGRLTTIFRLYPEASKAGVAGYRAQANRVWLTVGPGGDLFASYLAAPVVKTFSPSGRLLTVARLRGLAATRIAHAFWDPEARRGALVSAVDGREIVLATLGVSYDRSAGLVLVLAPFGTIFSLGRDGRQRGALHVYGAPGPQLWSLAGDGPNLWLARTFFPGAYTARLPSAWLAAAAAERR